jgi:hypothetical protein
MPTKTKSNWPKQIYSRASTAISPVNFSLDWPVLLPVRQHVPGRLGALEHAWKDGEPSAAVAGDVVKSEYDYSVIETSRVVNVCSRPLSGIMEGKAQGGGIRKLRHHRPRAGEPFHPRLGLSLSPLVACARRLREPHLREPSPPSVP